MLISFAVDRNQARILIVRSIYLTEKVFVLVCLLFPLDIVLAIVPAFIGIWAFTRMHAIVK